MRDPLQDRLIALCRWRRAARWATAAAMFGLAATCGIAALFWLDWQADLSRPLRLLAIVAWAGALGVMVRVAILPLLRRRESAVDMALEIERQQHIDSDLVAALQFQSPEAARWGSRQLESAVVEYVSDLGPHLHVDERAVLRPLRYLAAALLFACLGLLAAAWLHADHARAFVNRLFLGNAAYPTNTEIVSLAVNGLPIEISEPPEKSRPLRVAYGRSVRFEVRGDRALPEGGCVWLAPIGDGEPTEVPLTPHSGSPGVFVGELPRHVESLRYHVELGDARTPDRDLWAVELPVVTLSFQATPPAYAVASSPTDVGDTGNRVISVIQGTRISVRLVARNKALRKAILTLGDEQFAFSPEGESLRSWQLQPEGTPLSAVHESQPYKIQVVDEDGFALPEPIEGTIHINADRPPRVSAALVTTHVLPTGKPSLRYGAADDYGVAQVRVRCQVAGSMREYLSDIPLAEPHAKVVQGQYRLDLAKMEVVKGDELLLTLEAVDYRGTLPGATTITEPPPLKLIVTDERGVLAAMAESDQRSARQLETIIQRELGIGGEP